MGSPGTGATPGRSTRTWARATAASGREPRGAPGLHRSSPTTRAIRPRSWTGGHRQPRDFTLLGRPPGEAYHLRFSPPPGGSSARPEGPGSDQRGGGGGRLIDPSGVGARPDLRRIGGDVYLLYDDDRWARRRCLATRNEPGGPRRGPDPRRLGGTAAPAGGRRLPRHGPAGPTDPGGGGGGFYRFDVPPWDPAMAYRVVVGPPAAQLAFPRCRCPRPRASPPRARWSRARARPHRRHHLLPALPHRHRRRRHHPRPPPPGLGLGPGDGDQGRRQGHGDHR